MLKIVAMTLYAEMVGMPLHAEKGGNDPLRGKLGQGPFVLKIVAVTLHAENGGNEPSREYSGNDPAR